MDTVRLAAASVTLDSIAIVADLVQRNPQMADFFRRRDTRTGQFVTQADINRAGRRRTSDALRQMNGVEVRCEQAGGGRADQPCRILSRRALEPCELQIVLDGQRSSLQIDEIPVAWIAGIEVYTGSTAPPMFSHGACGVVVIWTDKGQR
jgi:hypothetical protein